MESTLGAQGSSILTILLHCGRSHTPCFYSSRPFLLRDVLNFLQIMLEIKFFMKGVGVNKKKYNQCAVQRAGRPSCDKMKLGKIQVAQNCQKNEDGKTRTSWWFVIKWYIIISFITMSCECISKEDRVVWGITVTVAGNSTFSLFTTNRVISPLLPRPCKTPIAKCFSFSQK